MSNNIIFLDAYNEPVQDVTPELLYTMVFMSGGDTLETATAYWHMFDCELLRHGYVIVPETDVKEPTIDELKAAIERAEQRQRTAHTKPCLTCSRSNCCKKTAAECKRYSAWLSDIWQRTTADLKKTAHTVRPKFRFKIVYPD